MPPVSVDHHVRPSARPAREVPHRVLVHCHAEAAPLQKLSHQRRPPSHRVGLHDHLPDPRPRSLADALEDAELGALDVYLLVDKMIRKKMIKNVQTQLSTQLSLPNPAVWRPARLEQVYRPVSSRHVWRSEELLWRQGAHFSGSGRLCERRP